MKHITAAVLLVVSILALPRAAPGENILANGSIEIEAASTNAVTQRIILDSYKGMQWANVRAIRMHNDSVAGANTTATYTVYCNDLDAKTVLATGTLAADAYALKTFGTTVSTTFSTTNEVGVYTVATNTFSIAPARIVDITIQPDTAVTNGAAHYWHYLIYAE
jgi:hypothetical protein